MLAPNALRVTDQQQGETTKEGMQSNVNTIGRDGADSNATTSKQRRPAPILAGNEKGER